MYIPLDEYDQPHETWCNADCHRERGLYMNLPFTPDTLERVTPPHTLRTYTLTETKSINTCFCVEISARQNTHGIWLLEEKNAFHIACLILTRNKHNHLRTCAVQCELTHPLPAGLLVERPHPCSLPVLSERPEREKWGQEALNSGLRVASAQPVPEQQAPHSSSQGVVGETQGQLPWCLSALRSSATSPGPQRSLRELKEPCEHNQERDAEERHQDRPAYVLKVHRLPGSLGSHFQRGLESLVHQCRSLWRRETEWWRIKKQSFDY